MSTKSTICYSDDFHLYEEVFDDQNVHLDLTGNHSQASIAVDNDIVQISISIPRNTMEQIAITYLKDQLLELVSLNPELHLTSSSKNSKNISRRIYEGKKWII